MKALVLIQLHQSAISILYEIKIAERVKTEWITAKSVYPEDAENFRNKAEKAQISIDYLQGKYKEVMEKINSV